MEIITRVNTVQYKTGIYSVFHKNVAVNLCQ